MVRPGERGPGEHKEPDDCNDPGLFEPEVITSNDSASWVIVYAKSYTIASIAYTLVNEINFLLTGEHNNPDDCNEPGLFEPFWVI